MDNIARNTWVLRISIIDPDGYSLNVVREIGDEMVQLHELWHKMSQAYKDRYNR